MSTATLPEVAFDEARADRAVSFFEGYLKHTKGAYARRPFILEPWQREDILRPLFGTVRWDDQLEAWVRLYSLAWIELGRKNGKSEVAAGIALLLLCADDEEGAEVYGCARDREQASLIFNVAKRMVELSPKLASRLKVIDSKKRILDPKTSSTYQVISADAAGNLGQDPHGIIFDEVIAQPSADLWDVLKSGMGVRTQPLMVALTNAGNDSGSFAAEEHVHSERVAADPNLDPSRFVYMRNTPREADWRDEANWHYANPALGRFLNINTLRAEAREAESSPRKQNKFRQFRLTQWVRQVTRWLDLALWDENAGMVIEDQLDGQLCFGGVDLAATSDFVAWVMFFPPDPENEAAGAHVLARFWLPESAVKRRSAMRETLDAWQLAGWLEVTEGDVINEDAIYNQIDRDAARFEIRQTGYDRWGARQLIRRLEAAGMACEGVSQTTQQLNDPCLEIERLLGLRWLHAGGNPIMRWMADNVSTVSDPDGRIKPSKKHSTEKIDGISALVNAIHRHLAQEDEQAVAFMAG